jgi:hypothetical protein
LRRAAVADESRDGGDAERWLRREQLGCGTQTLAAQISREPDRAELRVGALQLARRARQRACDERERDGTGIVARDDLVRTLIQAPTARKRVVPHADCSDRRARL